MKVALISIKKIYFQSLTTKSSNMQNHRTKPTNNETLYWYKESLVKGKVSEEKFNSEAIMFFNLSPEQSTKSKQIFKREILNFMTEHTNKQKNLTFCKNRGVQENILRCLQISLREVLKMKRSRRRGF